MTVTYTEDDRTKIAELSVNGKVTKNDFNAVAGKLEAFMKKHGKVKILEDIQNYEGFELSTMWEGIKFDAKNLKHVSHCAVVSDISIIKPLAKATSLLTPLEIKTFPKGQVKQARQWLSKQ